MFTLNKFKHLLGEVLAHLNALYVMVTEPGIRLVTTTTYTLVAADIGRSIVATNAATQTIALNTGLMKAGQKLVIYQNGVGAVELDPGAGVTVNGGTTNVAVGERYNRLEVLCIAANSYIAARTLGVDPSP